MPSKPEAHTSSGTSLPGTWLLGRRRPAYRGREADAGFRVELHEPGLRCQGRSRGGESREARVLTPRTGADRSVGAMKDRNGAGAKGSGQTAGIDETTGDRMKATMPADKPFQIDKKRVYEAYKAVRSNHGAAGVDGQSLAAFEKDLKGNLYKIWNRMSSGSYFPPPVRAVSIPKKSGDGERILGVPTVGDRIAQMSSSSSFAQGD
jgi:hypothetical protein